MALSGLVFAAFFFSLMGMALFRHPRYGLYAYIAVFYIHPPSRWWGAFLPDLRWSLLAGVVTLIAVWRWRGDNEDAAELKTPWFSSGAAKLLIGYTLWLWIQNFWALSPAIHLDASILFTKYLVLFYLIYRIVDNTAEMQRFFLVHILGCFYLGWLAWGASFSGRLEGVGGPGIDEANAMAMQLGTAVMCGSMLVLVGPGLLRWLAVLAMPFILNAMVLTGSRGAFLSLMAGSAILWWCKPKSHRKIFYALGVLALMLGAMVANQSFWERMGTIKTGLQDESQMDVSAFSRFVIVEAQIKMAFAYPFGSGHRGTAVLSPLYMEDKYLANTLDETAPRQRSSHNTFMTTWAEQGFPGAIMFLGICGWAYFTIRRIRHLQMGDEEPDADVAANTAALAAAMMLIFVAGMFVDYLKMEVQVWFLALLAAQNSIVGMSRLGIESAHSVAMSDTDLHVVDTEIT